MDILINSNIDGDDVETQTIAHFFNICRVAVSRLKTASNAKSKVSWRRRLMRKTNHKKLSWSVEATPTPTTKASPRPSLTSLTRPATTLRVIPSPSPPGDKHFYWFAGELSTDLYSVGCSPALSLSLITIGCHIHGSRCAPIVTRYWCSLPYFCTFLYFFVMFLYDYVIRTVNKCHCKLYLIFKLSLPHNLTLPCNIKILFIYCA